MAKEVKKKIIKKTKEEIKKQTNQINPKVKLGFVLVIIILIAILIINPGKESKIVTKTDSTLKEIIEMNELQTIEYTYNAVATKYANKEKKIIEYYVSYEGKVIAGINFKDIEIETDKKNKLVTITLPEIEIQDTIVDEDSLDFIFSKEKYDKPNTLKEATTICKKDLASRVKESELVYEAAKENAVTTVRGLFEPWIKSVSEEYTVEIK